MSNGQQPATRQDLADLEQRVVERIQDTETNILKAFYSFAEINQKHLSDLDRSDSSLRERVGAIETRLIEVEKRLNMPPA